MKKIIVFLGLLLQFCINYKVIFLADHLKSKFNYDTSNYVDNYHKISLSKLFDSSNSSKEFTITGKFEGTSGPATGMIVTIMYIQLNSDPSTYFMKLRFDPANNKFSVQEQKSPSTLTSQDFTYNKFFNTQHEFAVSFQQIDSSSYKISLILRNSQNPDLKNSFTLTSNLVLSDLSQYDLYLSSYQPEIPNPAKFYLGSVYKVFGVRNTYIDFTTDQELAEFALSLTEQATEYLTLFDQFVRDPSDYSQCIPDESILQNGCIYNSNPPTQYGVGYKLFGRGDNMYYNKRISQLFYYNRLNTPEPLFLTFSFWFYLDSVDVTENSSSKQGYIQSFYFGNQQFLSIQYYYISDTQYQLYMVRNNNQGVSLTGFTLNTQTNYFLLFSYYGFTKQRIQVLIYDNSGLQLNYQEQFSQPNYDLLGEYAERTNAILNLGDVVYRIKSFYKISQYKITLSASIIYSTGKAANLIANCEVAIFARNEYQCLLCKVNTFLYENSCIDSCNPTLYVSNSDTRRCIRRCSNKCNQCSQDDPNQCSICSSSDRDLTLSCQCKQGYENYNEKACLPYRVQTQIYEVKEIQSSVYGTYSIDKTFNPALSKPPYVIISITKIKSNNSDIKSLKIISSVITTTQISLQLQGSKYIGGSFANTDFKLQLIVIPSDKDHFYSGILYYQFTDVGTQAQNINLGNYDVNKYGDYQVITFLSGIQFGDNTGSALTISVDLDIQVNAMKTQIEVISNMPTVQEVQVGYLIFPATMTYFSHKESIQQDPGVYIDSSQKHYSKTHLKTQLLGGIMTSPESFRLQPLVGFSGLKLQFLKSQFSFDYQLIPKSDPSVQQIRLSVEGYNLYRYSGNVLYFAEYQDLNDNCATRQYSTGICLRCNYDKLHLYNDCLTAYVGLTIKLSTKFDNLQIIFNEVVSLIDYGGADNTYNLCKYIFNSSTLSLIGLSALCSLKQQQITVTLEQDSTIKQWDMITFNQVLMIAKYKAKIIDFQNYLVDQDPLTPANVVLEYLSTINICDNILITIKEFLNHQNRGVKEFKWSIDYIAPYVQSIQEAVNQIIEQVNLLQNPTIYINRYLITQEVQIQLTLSYTYHIGITGSQSVNLSVIGQPQMNIRGRQIVEGPYFLKDKIEIYFDIEISNCDDLAKQKYDKDQIINLNISEPTLNLNKDIQIQNKRAFSQIFSPYTLQTNTQYEFKITGLTDYGMSHTIFYYLIISKTPLIVQIQGGNRVQDYGNPIELISIIKDMDIDQSLNLDQQISFTWSCLDLITQKECRDIENKIIPLPQNSNVINFPSFTFIPYSNVQLTLSGTKDTRTQVSQIVISFIDSSVPHQQVVFQDDILLRNTINWNDMIEATINYQSNEDVNLLFFGGAIIYQKQVVAGIKFDYGKVRFSLWSFYSQFVPTSKVVVLRFSVYNPKYSIPSESVIQFNLNFPPTNCQLQTIPNLGKSLEDIFEISVSNCQDYDQPISYKFFYYKSEDQYKQEVKNPLLIQRRQISDKMYSSVVKTYLPSGENFILVQVIDSKNAIQNMTSTISVSQSDYDETSYVQLVKQVMDFANGQTKLMQIQTLSILSEDIISRPTLYSSIKQQVYQIIAQLKDLSNNEYESSTFQTLVTQSLTQFIQNNLHQTDQISIQSNLDYVKDILTTIQTNLPVESQQKKSFYNQQIFNSFNLLDQNANNIQTSNSLQQNTIKLSEQIGNLLNLDALPNESPKKFVGTNVIVMSQQITSKNLPIYIKQNIVDNNWENDIIQTTKFEEKLNQVYDVSFKQYKKNLFKEEQPFQDYLKSYKQKKPDYQLLDYKVIEPEIKLQDTQENFNLFGPIKFTFSPIKNENLTCINRNENQWTSKGCETVYNEKNKNFDCLCNSLNSVTVINDIENIFTENKNIDTIFSNEGISNIISFDDFYKYLAFWELAFITLIFFGLLLYGSFLDKVYQKSLPIQAKTQVVSTSSNIIIQSKQQQQQQQLFQQQAQQEQQQKQSIILSQQEQNDDFNLNNEGKQIITNDLDKNENQKQQNTSKIQLNKQNSLLLEQNNDKGSFQRALSYDYGRQTTKRCSKIYPNLNIETNTGDLYMPTNPQINFENQQDQKKHPDHNIVTEENQIIEGTQRIIGSPNQIFLSEKSLINPVKVVDDKSQNKLLKKPFLASVLYFHDLFSIFKIYDPQISRFTRFLIYYIRILHLYDSNIIFSDQYSIVQVIFLQVVNILVVSIVQKFIEYGFSKKRLIKILTQIVIYSLVGFYYYAFFAVVSDKEPSATNLKSLYFFIILSINILITDVLLAILFRFIGMKLISSNLIGFKVKIYEFIKLALILQNL